MRILIIGAGRLGSILAKNLSERGHEIIVVDKNEERVKKLTEEVDVAGYVRDATDPTLYDELSLPSIDVIVAATDRDEVNLFTAIISREYGVPRIIAKVRDPRIASILQRIGLTEYVVVEPNIISSIIEAVIEGKYSVVELLPIYVGGFRLVTITIAEGSDAEGHLLDDVKYPREGVKILTVFDGKKFHDPGEVIRLEAGHQIIAIVRDDLIEEFLEAFR